MIIGNEVHSYAHLTYVMYTYHTPLHYIIHYRQVKTPKRLGECQHWEKYLYNKTHHNLKQGYVKML